MKAKTKIKSQVEVEVEIGAFSKFSQRLRIKIDFSLLFY